MIVKNANELREIVSKILSAAGASAQNADLVAEHLVLSNLSGVDTHGVWHVKGYVEAIRDGDLVPTTSPETIRETPTSALVSGHWTFGQVAALHAVKLAIEKAKSQNAAVVGLVESHHIGRLGHFVELAAAEGMISMVWAGGQGHENPMTVPHGGRERLLHTNPIAMGFPAGKEPPMTFDFATTALSGVKVENARRRNEPLPPGCVVDSAGNPTTDAQKCIDGGAYQAFGGHKGYAMMMAVEYLGRILCGANSFADPDRGGMYLRYQGVTMIVLRADLFQSLADYEGLADDMAQRTRAVPPAPGFDEVLVPGDPEVRSRAQREREGIPIHDDVWQTIVEAANSLGIAEL